MYSSLQRMSSKVLLQLGSKFLILKGYLIFGKCSKDEKFKSIYKEILSQCTAASNFPVVLYDFQTMIILDLPQHLSQIPIKDENDVIRFPFDIFVVRNEYRGSKSHLKYNTSISFQIAFLLAIFSVPTEITKLEQYVWLSCKTPRQINLVYHELLQKCKDETNLTERATLRINGPPLSPNAKDERLQCLKSIVKTRSERYTLKGELPVMTDKEVPLQNYLVLDAKTFSDMTGIKYKLPLGSKTIMMKLYNLDLLSCHFEQEYSKIRLFMNDPTCSLESFVATYYHERYLNEVSMNLFLDDYNENCLARGSRIRKPKCYGYGELITPGYRGFFLLFQHLPFFDDKRLSKSKLKDGMKQLKNLHYLSICYGHLEEDNTCAKNGELWLYDFQRSELFDPLNLTRSFPDDYSIRRVFTCK